MLNVLEKLSVRKTEVSQANQAVWSKLVVDVADEILKDADEILTALDDLRRSPEDLQEAIELLHDRRGWAAVVAAGDVAESEYPKLTQAAATAIDQLADLIEKHTAKNSHVNDKVDQARDAITAAATARRQLLESCSAVAAESATAGIDSQLAGIDSRRSEMDRLIREREDWLSAVESQGAQAARSDRTKMPGQIAGLANLRADYQALTVDLERLNSEREQAATKMLHPEFF